MKKFSIIFIFIVLSVGTCYAGTAVGIVTTNQQQEYNYQLSRAWGWCNDDNYEKPLRNFFDSSDDCVKKPKRKMVFLKVPTKKDNK